MAFSSIRSQKWERTVACSIILTYLAHLMRVRFCVWYDKCAKYLAFDTFERAYENALKRRRVEGNGYLLPCFDVFKISKGKWVIIHSSYLDVLKIMVEKRGK